MLIGVLTVAVIAVGLPLFAWWVGGRRIWARLERTAQQNPYAELVRRHHLTATERAQVESDVAAGRRLDDPRLRAAAVDWAQTSLARLTESGTKAGRLNRWMFWLGWIYLLVVLAGAVFAVSFGKGVPGAFWLFLVNGIASVAPRWVMQRKLRRAVELNSRTADGSGGQV